MGIDLIAGLFLARHLPGPDRIERGLILGRRKLRLAGDDLDRFVGQAGRPGGAMAPQDLAQEDGLAPVLFGGPGCPPMEVMDFAAGEGVAHVHNLNRPVPPNLRGKFDLVIDGGTTEHVFHIGQALENCHSLLRPGGLFLSFVAADGCFGHGFFQTGPDVTWRYWHHARGYEMLEVSLVACRDPLKPVPVEEPTGRPRGGGRTLAGPQMLLTAARKPLKPPACALANPLPMQGHYAGAEP